MEKLKWNEVIEKEKLKLKVESYTEWDISHNN